MLKNDETITMTLSDFTELVQKEVRNELRKELNYVHPNRLFPSHRDIKGSIKEINKSNETVYKEISRDSLKEIMHLYSTYTDSEMIEMSKDYHKHSEPINVKREFSTNEHVHNSIRSLALAIFGQTLNRDLEQRDYIYANEYYNRILGTFLECYQERIDREYPEE